MANAVVNNLFRAILHGRDAHSIFLNIRHYKVTAVTGAGLDDTVVARAINTTLSTTYLDTFSSEISLEKVTAQRLTAAGVAILDAVEDTHFLPAPGTGTGGEMPSYVAGIVSLRTGLAGKSGRGRIFCWPPSEGFNDVTGVPNATWKANALIFGTALLSTITSTVGADSITLVPCLFSKVFGNATPLTNVLVRAEWADLRRRKIGVGK